MIDQKGIKRSFCTECNGEEKCTEFEKSDQTPFCGYCGCPALKHKRESIAVEVPEKENSATIYNCDTNVVKQYDAGVNAQSVSFEKNNLPDIDDRNRSVSFERIERGDLNALIPPLPQYSQCVEHSLISRKVIGPLWSNLIMQTAVYYADCESLNTKSAYEIVGRRMFDKYPCIEGPGPKPWTHFTKCLSQKLRTERLKRKGFKASLKEKSFTDLQNQNDDGEVHTNRSSRVSDNKARTFCRSDANVQSLLSETEILGTRTKIANLWKEKDPEKGLIKSHLRDTFNDRSALLEKGISFKEFLEYYPCFEDANYILYEFNILIGRNKMQELGDKMKLFFEKLHNCHGADSGEGDILLSDWLWFEKNCGIFQTKGEKSSPIIDVTVDNAEYQAKLKSAFQFPHGVVLLQNGEIKDCAIIFASNFITVPKLNVISLLMLILALYYIIELNYPKQFVQAMGSLAYFVLDHQFYKLGSRAKKMLKMLEK